MIIQTHKQMADNDPYVSACLPRWLPTYLTWNCAIQSTQIYDSTFTCYLSTVYTTCCTFFTSTPCHQGKRSCLYTCTLCAFKPISVLQLVGSNSSHMYVHNIVINCYLHLKTTEWHTVHSISIQSHSFLRLTHHLLRNSAVNCCCCWTYKITLPLTKNQEFLYV